MKRELVDDIYKRLLNEDWKGLPPYLKGGQMGMCMFMALYSEYRNCGKARSLSARLSLYNICQIAYWMEKPE